MSKLMNRLTALQESLRNAAGADADSFERVFSEFLDITETAELVPESKPIKDRGMRSLIEVVVRRHANDPTLAVTGLRMLRHTATNLFHGGFFAGPFPGTFFYFVGEQQGIVALSQGRTTHYWRISAIELPQGTVIGRKRWSIN